MGFVLNRRIDLPFRSSCLIVDCTTKREVHTGSFQIAESWSTQLIPAHNICLTGTRWKTIMFRTEPLYIDVYYNANQLKPYHITIISYIYIFIHHIYIYIYHIISSTVMSCELHLYPYWAEVLLRPYPLRLCQNSISTLHLHRAVGLQKNSSPYCLCITRI